MLNIIWSAFFIVSFIAAVVQSVFMGNATIWTEITDQLFSAATNAFQLALNLTGMLCLWLGMLKIAEKSGLTEVIAKALRPFFKLIMPQVPENSPAIGSIVMNIAANVLGLDNAATPMGLKAMEQLQASNPKKDEASDAQIMFIVLNSSALTVLPISILMYRHLQGATNAGAVFIPILLATSCSTLAGFLAVSFTQKLRIFNLTVLSYFLLFLAVIGGIAGYFYILDAESRLKYSENCGNVLIMAAITLFLLYGACKKLNLYETFIEGAKEGFQIAVQIIPYLVAMLAAIAVLRYSGVLDGIVWIFAQIFEIIGINTDFIPALPTALMKPLSGNGARAMMLETMQTYGADSFPAFVASTIQGSTETTFYVIALYFGAIKISKTRSALPCALFADLVGIIAAICFSYLFYEG
ncbi:MAG: spore maturation protein [Alphaproteobacteria bacterium]|nr:spore maturation protein [Alphaproteobacteria bacterium]